MDELRKIINEDLKKRSEILSKLQEIQQTEQMNAYNIMVGSVLTATVIEARELRSTRLTGSANPYVIISIEG